MLSLGLYVSFGTVLQKVVLPASSGAVCNDGSPYAYYLYINDEASATSKWVFFQQGGSYCWDEASCKARASNLMSSKGLPSELTIANGILSDSPAENPYFASFNMVELPCTHPAPVPLAPLRLLTRVCGAADCTSDAFSGTLEQSSWSKTLSFLGSRVVPAVIADLKQNHGLVDGASTVVVYSGASAGAVGLYPNLDVLSSKLLPASHVVGVIDSGWFLDSVPLETQPCTNQPLVCSVKENLVRGVAAWNSSVDTDCAGDKGADEQWQCMMGHYVEPYLSTPIFVFEWQYDLAQLYHDGIEQNPEASAPALAYAQSSRANLTRTFEAAKRHHHFFSPACYQHVVLNAKHPTWLHVTAGNVTLAAALNDFVSGNSSSSVLLDDCTSPDCNPTCPPPQHIG